LESALEEAATESEVTIKNMIMRSGGNRK